MRERLTKTFPEGTKSIVDGWKNLHEEFTKIIIPESVTEIGECALGCNLEGVVVCIPYQLWSTLDIHCVTEWRGWYAASIVMKVLKEDGTYFYSYVASCAACDDYHSGMEFAQLWKNDEDIIESDDDIRARIYELKLPDAIMPYLCRLATPYKLGRKHEIAFVEYISKKFSIAVQQIALFDCPDMLRALYRYGLVTGTRQQKILTALQEQNAEECLKEFEAISNAAYDNPIAKKTVAIPKKIKAKTGLVTHTGTHKNMEVALSTGKKFLYSCPFPAVEGDRVLIGVGHSYEKKTSKNTGISGTIIDPKSEKPAKKDFMVDIAFAFSDSLKNQQLAKIPELLEKDFSDKLEAQDYNFDRVYPITYFVWKQVAALTFLQYPEITDGVEEVRAFVNRAVQFTEDDVKSIQKMTFEQVSVSDMKCAALTALTEATFGGKQGYKNGFLKVGSLQGMQKKLLSKNMNQFLKDYIPLATAEVLLRCNQTELLKTYFENCDTLSSYAKTILEMAKEVGATECESLISKYLVD